MYSQGRSKLWIAEQTGVSRNTAKKYMATFDASGLTFEQINSLNVFRPLIFRTVLANQFRRLCALFTNAKLAFAP